MHLHVARYHAPLYGATWLDVHLCLFYMFTQIGDQYWEACLEVKDEVCDELMLCSQPIRKEMCERSIYADGFYAGLTLTLLGFGSFKNSCLLGFGNI